MLNLAKAHDLDSIPRTEDIKVNEDIEFSSMFLDERILNGLKSCGFKKPSPIQLAAFPLGRCGLDLIIQSKSGTGKTLVFTLAILECIDLTSKSLQAIILTPTREIALQVSDVMSSVGCQLKGLKVGTFIGGRPVQIDQENSKNCQIAVGAPGRVKHLIKLRSLNLDSLSCFVLDEADQLMEDTFRDDIKFMLACKPDEAQVIACSATFTPIMIDFLAQFMRRPRHVTPEGDKSFVLLGIRQFTYCISPFMIDPLAQLFCKQRALMKILDSVSFDQCIIFVNFLSKAQSVSNYLLKQNHSAVWLAGNLEQEDRIKALQKLKSRECRILVTTDLAARGIDVPWVNLVINVDVPFNYKTYLHRIGRAGRYGSHGISISLVSSEDELTSFKRTIRNIQANNGLLPVRIIPKAVDLDLWTADDSSFELFDATEVLVSSESSGEGSSQEDSSLSDFENGEESAKSIQGDLDVPSLVSTLPDCLQLGYQKSCPRRPKKEPRSSRPSVDSTNEQGNICSSSLKHNYSGVTNYRMPGLRHEEMVNWYSLWRRQSQLIYNYSNCQHFS